MDWLPVGGCLKCAGFELESWSALVTCRLGAKSVLLVVVSWGLGVGWWPVVWEDRVCWLLFVSWELGVGWWHELGLVS